MVVRLPRSLTRKRAELAFERQQLRLRLVEVEQALSALDYSIKVVAPSWTPPRKVSAPAKKTLLPRGSVAKACLQFLRQRQELSTPELVQLVAAKHHLTFSDRRAEQDFASSVAMALRRYERQGVLQVVGKDERTGALRWRVAPLPDGRLVVVPQAA